MPKVEINWIEGVQFEAVPDSGHKIVMDAGREQGGTDIGARPMELFLVGLGGCTGIDVITILKKMRRHIKQFRLNITAEKAITHPKVYKKINLEYILEGDMEEKDVQRAIELSQQKFCSASAMLGKTAEITYSYRLLKTGNNTS